MHAYRPLAALSIILATVLLTTAIHTPSTTAKEPAAHTPAPLLMYRDIPWVTVGGKILTTDIFVPNTKRDQYPVVVIYHGGGWLINDNKIMESTAKYLAQQGEFVVANMNYRLLGDNHNTTTMGEIVEDALGGLLWVREHIADYHGDPDQIAVTGDSAGGHLSAMVLLAMDNLSHTPFGPHNLSFRPTYLPRAKTGGKTLEQIEAQGQNVLKAAVLSYGVFDLEQRVRDGLESPGNGFWKMGGAKARGIFGKDISIDTHPALYRAVSPIQLIPTAEERRLPPTFVHVGSKDTTTPPSAVKRFADQLAIAGQTVVFKEYADKNHAFLDSGCNEYLGNCFDEDAPETLKDMTDFLKRHFE
ncbi:alpha/beta hydrolase [Microbulbifer elongatus]|uniref:Alpha/beta hydrolase n=1 Tax=Microbulbifer elongatus TaxID=86173 RepID=A0ABT1NZ96_9GAMM|nr:alpha/beta hydrolase [Microbulbifer elongatus]MCQ3829146.1 alpha/beta hydrolase [Microbulbifer elongatus]